MRFKGKIWEAANSHVVTIPKRLIKYEHLDTEKVYEFLMREVKEEEE